MRTVAGLDLSLKLTGLVVLDVDTGTLIDCRSIKPKGKGLWRCRWLRNHLIGAMDKHRPVKIAIEGYAYGMRGQGVYQLGELGGIVRLGLMEAGVSIMDVPPATLKKFVTGKGNAKKELMMLAVYKRWGVSCSEHDEADAYGLAQLARATVTDVKLAKFQREALKALAA